MKGIIQKVSLPDDWAENMLAELDKEKEQAKRESEIIVQNLKRQKAEAEQKIEKLLDLYIAGGSLTVKEYQAKKQKLLNEKLDIEQKIRDFEQSGNNWLEPMREMIFEVKQAKILLSQGDNYQIREFLKNVGSNFILKDEKFNFAAAIGWSVFTNTLAESEPATSFSD
jgi:Icc-related predicted phosphoesterase